MPRPPASTDVVNVAVRFPTDLHDQLKERAAGEDLTLSQLLRRLARNYCAPMSVDA